MSCLQKLIEPGKYTAPNLPLASISWFESSKMYTDETPPGLVIAY